MLGENIRSRKSRRTPQIKIPTKTLENGSRTAQNKLSAISGKEPSCSLLRVVDEDVHIMFQNSLDSLVL
jgi:hypothetical protein